MVFEQVNIPRTIQLPTFAGNFNQYSADLNLALTTQVRDLWARAESLDNNSNIQDEVIKTQYIENLAVTDAKIDSLSVSKLTAGTITSQVITMALTEGVGDVVIKGGKTDFGDNTAGMIFGMDDSDSNKMKFEIGDATNYMKWTGAALNIRGSLNADDIGAGTLLAARFSTAIAYITNTAQIANAVISTANIGNLQVTSATIANLTIGHTKIADFAITRGAEFDSDTGAVYGDTETEIATITIACLTTADSVWLWGKDFVTQNPAVSDGKGGCVYAGGTIVNIRRTNTAGVIVASWTYAENSYQTMPHVMTAVDSPGVAGSQVYVMTAVRKTPQTSPCDGPDYRGIIAYRTLMGLARTK